MNNIEIQLINEEIAENEIEKIKEYCYKILNRLNIDDWEISVLVTDSDYIHELNRDYRGVDSPTDVLSFEQERFAPSEIYYAGDIVLCPAQIRNNCSEFNVGYEEEFLRMLIHGILHLSGLTHDGYEKTQPMLKKQEEILKFVLGEIAE
jgi:probable rRNA maturation factor